MCFCFSKLCVPKLLNELYYNLLCVMMYKYANDLLPLALNYLYTTNSYVHNYTTRQRHPLHVNKSNINTYSNSFGARI